MLWSVRISAYGAMTKADGAVIVAGRRLPESTMWITEVASAVCSVGLPVKGGKTRS